MITCVFPLYDHSPKLMQLHIDTWREIPLKYREQLHFVVIDDCSPTPVEINVDFPVNYTLARIDKDIYWNCVGAKNLGMTLADKDWIIQIDGTMQIEAPEFEKIFNLKKERGTFYVFDRWLPNGKYRNKNISGSCIIHYDDYWKSGGQDEDFAGNCGCSDWMIFGDIVRTPKEICLVKQIGIKLERTSIRIIDQYQFSCDPSKKRKTGINIKKYHKKLQQLKSGTYVHPPNLNFPWHIVEKHKI